MPPWACLADAPCPFSPCPPLCTQALLLGWCLHVRKGSAADGLQPWEMAAYVDAGALVQVVGKHFGALP